jgi:hypothetical protein
LYFINSEAESKAFEVLLLFKKLFVSVIIQVNRKVAILLSISFSHQNFFIISQTISEVEEAFVSIILIFQKAELDE